jgi:hypothetical protein
MRNINEGILIKDRIDGQGHPATMHRIHIELPSSESYIPFLSIIVPVLDLQIDASAQGTSFGTVFLGAPEIKRLPDGISAHNLTIIGDTGIIEGTYNISSHLIMQLNQGVINASVNLVDHSHHNSSKEEEPVKVDAQCNIGDIDLQILSIADGLESDVTAEVRVGDVLITHAPNFEGRVERDVEVGESGLEIGEGKEMCCEQGDDGHEYAWVWTTEELKADADDTYM